MSLSSSSSDGSPTSFVLADMEFRAWLGRTLTAAAVCTRPPAGDARSLVHIIVAFLRSVRSPADLMQCSDRLAQLLNDACCDENIDAPGFFMDVEALADEIVSRYHLTGVAQYAKSSPPLNADRGSSNNVDSGVCGSPSDATYDTAFPPLCHNAPATPHAPPACRLRSVDDDDTVGILLLDSGSEEEEENAATDYVGQRQRLLATSFDGTERPTFVMPRGAVPRPPAHAMQQLCSSWPSNHVLSGGWFATAAKQPAGLLTPHALDRAAGVLREPESADAISGPFAALNANTTARQRAVSSTYDNNDVATFCVPRVAFYTQHQQQRQRFLSERVPPLAQPHHQPPVSARTHFAPIRSDSMSWAYEDAYVDEETVRALAATAAALSPPPGLSLPPESQRQLFRPRVQRLDVVTAFEPHDCFSAAFGHPTREGSDGVWRCSSSDEEHGLGQQRHLSSMSPYVQQRYSDTPQPMQHDDDDAIERLEDEQLLSYVGGIAALAPLHDED